MEAVTTINCAYTVGYKIFLGGGTRIAQTWPLLNVRHMSIGRQMHGCVEKIQGKPCKDEKNDDAYTRSRRATEPDARQPS